MYQPARFLAWGLLDKDGYPIASSIRNTKEEAGEHSVELWIMKFSDYVAEEERIFFEDLKILTGSYFSDIKSE